MLALNLIFQILWIIVKNTIFYLRSKEEKGDLATFIIWLLISFGVIELGIYVFQLSYNAFFLVTPIKSNSFTLIYYATPYAIDFITNFIISRHIFTKNILGVLKYELARGFLFLLLILAVSFIFSVSFWLIIFLANVLHWKIAGHQY